MKRSYPISVLDLAPVGSGMTGTDALRNSLDLARHADRLGYKRYWFAEHHNMPGIASASPEILIGQAARETSRIRVGSGGVMLPNHAPLKVAENFLTLEALFPGRIDLGIGRAPGTDPLTARAFRRPGRTAAGGSDDLLQQLDDLFGFAEGNFPEGHPFKPVSAVPRGVPLPPVWLLGSSDFSARLAAERGLGFVFARHINPDDATYAMRLYRENFKPSAYLSRPYSILTVSAICADDAETADELASSTDLSFLLLRQGRAGYIPSVAEAKAYLYTDFERELIAGGRARMVLGTPQTVCCRLEALAEETQADELMVMTITHDHAARVKSYELLAEEFGLG